MKKRRMKRSIVMIMAVIMMFSLAGCGKKEETWKGDSKKEDNKEKDSKKEEKPDAKEMVYEGTDLSLEGIEGDVSTIVVEDEKIYFSTNKWNEELKKQKIRLYCMNLDGSDKKEIPIPELKEDMSLLYMSVEDNTIALMLSSYNTETEEIFYSIMKLDMEGNELLKEDVTDTLKLTGQTHINKALADDKGRFIVATEWSVFVLDESCKLLYEMKQDSNYIESIAKMKDGRIICAFRGEDGVKVQVLDIDNKEWGESYTLDLQRFWDSNSLMNGIEYDFYYADNTGVYGYDITEKKGTKILDYLASNLTADTYGIMPIAKEQLIGTEWSGESVRMILYKKVDAAMIEDKTTITLGSMWVDDKIKKAAIEFNKNNKEYQIEIKDYSQEENRMRMNADITAGNIPDIIGLHNMPLEQYVEKGLLEDLTPYYEKDPDIKTTDLIPSVAKAMQIDGKYYYIAPSFRVSTLIGNEKDVGTEMGWTFDDMKALLKEKGENVRPFYSEYKSDILYSFLKGSGLNDFIDWTTGECSFDSQDFKDILEICNTGKDGERIYEEDAPSQASLIKEGKVLFVDECVDMESIELYKKMFSSDITFIGYPNKEKQGSYFNFNYHMGIYSKSDVKDGAWEFIRSFMTKEYQGISGNIRQAAKQSDQTGLL